MYKISDFSKKTNTQVETLRYYDKIDLFKPSYIDKYTGYRYYQPNQIHDINLIKELRSIGLSLDKIKLYIETSDINIILNYQDEMKNKMEKIGELIMNKDKKEYKVTQQDYKKYVEINGTREAESERAIEIKNGTVLYFIIENVKFYGDFCLYPSDENYIGINWEYVKNDELMKTIIKCIKETCDIKYISIVIPVEYNELIEYAKNKYTNSEVSSIKQLQWEYTRIKINI